MNIFLRFPCQGRAWPLFDRIPFSKRGGPCERRKGKEKKAVAGLGRGEGSCCSRMHKITFYIQFAYSDLEFFQLIFFLLTPECSEGSSVYTYQRVLA